MIHLLSMRFFHLIVIICYIIIVTCESYKPVVLNRYLIGNSKSTALRTSSIVANTNHVNAQRSDCVTLLAGRYNSQSRRSRKRNSLRLTLTNMIIGVNVVLYLLTMRYPSIKYNLMKIDHRIARGEIHRLVSSLFLHGSTFHLLTNSYSLYNIGPQAERMFGTLNFLLIYLGSGVMANLGTFLAGTAPFSLGASGSTFGLIGAFAAHFFVNKRYYGKRASESALESIKRTIFINFLYGASMPNVDNWAHVGGLLAGGAISYVTGPRYSKRPQLRGSRYSKGSFRYGYGGAKTTRKNINNDYDDYGDLNED